MSARQRIAMKILADKIENGPPHNLSLRDLRLIFKVVPLDWKNGVKEVHVSNSLEWRGGLACAFFSRYDGCLTIYSRKVTTEQALHAVLCELAAISLRVDRGLRRRPKAVLDRLSKMIEPLMQTLLPLVDSKSHVQKRVSLEGFRELHFAPFPNDSKRE
jgi:hypothetical protein